MYNYIILYSIIHIIPKIVILNWTSGFGTCEYNTIIGIYYYDKIFVYLVKLINRYLKVTSIVHRKINLIK